MGANVFTNTPSHFYEWIGIFVKVFMFKSGLVKKNK